MTKNVHNAIKKNPQRANKILFEICQSCDLADPSESSEDNDDLSDSNSDKEPTTNIVQQIKESNINHVEENKKDFDPWDF